LSDREGDREYRFGGVWKGEEGEGYGGELQDSSFFGGEGGSFL